MKAFKVIWQTLPPESGSLYLTASRTPVNKEKYFTTQEAAIKFIEKKDQALRELELNNGQLYMPTLHEVELE